MLPAAGRPTRVCRPAPLFRPACTRHATRHTPRATRHAPRTAHPAAELLVGSARDDATAGHRAKSNAKSTGSIAPRATRTRRHRAKSTADGVTRTMPPVRHGPDAPDRRQPSFDSRLHRQQAIDSRLHRQQAPSTVGSIDSRLRRHPADQLAADMSRYRLRCRLRRGRTFSGRGGGCAWWLRLVAAPGSCACGSDRARVCVYARFAAQWCSVQRCNACDCPRCMNSRCLEVPALPQCVKLALSASARAA